MWSDASGAAYHISVLSLMAKTRPVKRSRVIAFPPGPDSPPTASSSDAVRVTSTNNNARNLRTAQAHTVTVRPSNRRQSQKSAQSALVVDMTEEEDESEPLDNTTHTGVADEHLDAFEEQGDESQGETEEDVHKRPAVCIV